MNNLPQISEAYHKARRQYGLFSGLLLTWELLGIELAKKLGSGGVSLSVRNPELAPSILAVLIVYLGFRISIEWAQCDVMRRESIAARIDFTMAHLIGISALILYLVQKLSAIRLASYIGVSLTWSVFGAGIILAIASSLRPVFNDYGGEYANLAISRSWKSLVFVTLFLFFIGGNLLIIISPEITLKGSGLSLLIGILVGGVPHILTHLLPRGMILRSLNMLGLNLVYKITMKAQQCLETDNFSWQSREGEWDFGVPPEEIARRIRKLYELHKLEISNYSKNSHLLKSDVGHFPGRKFYPLAKYLGRKTLLELLAKSVDLPWGWDGSERRHVDSDASGRGRPGKKFGRRRIYDNSSLIAKIKKGKIDAEDVQTWLESVSAGRLDDETVL